VICRRYRSFNSSLLAIVVRLNSQRACPLVVRFCLGQQESQNLFDHRVTRFASLRA
jgi:hypothetical protein